MMWLLIMGVLIAAVAWTAPRLLGTHPTAGAGAWCAAVGTAAATGTAVLARRTEPGTFVDPGLLLMVAVLAAMATAVGLELLGGLRPPGPVTLVRAIATGVRRSRRYSSLMRIASRNGLTLARTQKASTPHGLALGEALREALTEAGPLFIKAGQLLAVRPGLLPADVARPLSDLHDSVPPADAALIDTALYEHYGSPVEDVFATFCPTPVAAASMAQVHRAVLHDGTVVAVKILRPDAPARVATDLDVLARLARTLERRTTWGKATRISTVVDEFATTVRAELDLRIEARTQAAAHTAAHGSPIRVPGVHPGLSGRNVLVQDFAHGTPAHRAAPDLDDNSARAAATRIADGYLALLLHHGITHADPHPGNIHIHTQEPPALLDFGLSARLDALQLAALRDILTALALREPTALARALNRAADHPADDTVLERACAQLLLSLPEPGNTPSSDADTLTALTTLAQGTGLSLPPVYTTVLRGLAVLESTCLTLDPGFHLATRLRTVAQPELRSIITSRLAAILDRPAPAPQPAQTRHTCADRLVLTLIAATTGGVAASLIRHQTGPQLAPGLHLLEVIGSLGLAASAVLLMRVLMQTLQPVHASPPGIHARNFQSRRHPS